MSKNKENVIDVCDSKKVPVAARLKAAVCGRSLAGTAGCMDVNLL
jgi:hypothetical protein